MPVKPVFKDVSIVERAPAAADGPIQFVASTEDVDRYGDVVRADGWELDAYRRNPVALFAHDHAAPIGTTKVWLDGRRLMSELHLAAPGTSPLVDSVRALIGQGVLRAVSVGFLPLEEPRPIRAEKGAITGYEFTRQELLEISVVSVPANPSAIAVVRSLDIPESVRKVLLASSAKGRIMASTYRARCEIERLRKATSIIWRKPS